MLCNKKVLFFKIKGSIRDQLTYYNYSFDCGLSINKYILSVNEVNRKKIKFIYRILPTSFIYFLFSPVITLIMFTLNSLQLTKEIWRKLRCVWGLADVCVCVILTSFIFSPVIILITHTVNYFNNFRNKTWIPYNWLRKYEVCVGGGGSEMLAWNFDDFYFLSLHNLDHV